MKQADRVTTAATEPVAFVYDVVLKLAPDGDGISSEPVVLADVIDVYGEAWLETHLRRGRPDVAFDELSFRLLPQLADASDRRCSCLLIETQGPDGMTFYRRLGLQALSAAAARAARRLIATRRLSPKQSYFYDVVARRRQEPVREGADLPASHNRRTVVRHPPVAHLQMPLPTLKQQAKAIGSVEGWIPVFYVTDTFSQAERLARMGATVAPPVESGAVVAGVPCACPATGEFFVVATEVIALQEPLQAQTTLFYTGKTWGRIQATLDARRHTPAGRALRIVGQCHGHNFRPQWLQERCVGCTKRQAGGLDTAFVSEEDIVWSRCVFSRQPWAFCHIFGRDVRADPVHRMYGFRDGRLVERGFYLIDALPGTWNKTQRHRVAGDQMI